MALLLPFALLGATAAPTTNDAGPGVVRTYYVAADEVTWNYAPGGISRMSGLPFDEMENIYVKRGKHRIGSVYKKALYREYTDATFTHRKPRPAAWAHLGLLGPVLRAEVSDTIKVVFKNNASRAYSMHPHGVFYDKDSEGSNYSDGVAASAKGGGAVAPGKVHTYVWKVPERAGPGPGDVSSVVWLYHSHVEEQRDVNAGLVGTMIVTARGMARPDGSPKDVDREFVTLFNVFDENQSWYLKQNIQAYAIDPKHTKMDEAIPLDMEGAFTLNGKGFVDANFKFSMNGYSFGTSPVMVMKQNDHVRWYQVAIGFGFNFHTPHWHGNAVVLDRKRTDVTSIAPAQMISADMVPDNPGTWLYHCHVSDHMHGGMLALYRVDPAK